MSERGAWRKRAVRRAIFLFGLWICWALVLVCCGSRQTSRSYYYVAGWDKPGPVFSKLLSDKNRRDGSSIPP